MMQESDDGTTLSSDSERVPPTPASRLPSPSPSEAEADGGAVGREIRRRLMKWWTEEYCASRMSLCILGKGIYQSPNLARMLNRCVESLDELSDMASKLFSPIVRRGNDPLPMINDHPFGAAEKGVGANPQIQPLN